MKEYPILFQTEMVQALLAGTKSQTRRTTRLQVVNQNPNAWEYVGSFVDESGELQNRFKTKNGGIADFKCPYGAPGSILWGRENWRKYRVHEDDLSYYHGEDIIEYQADGHTAIYQSDGDGWQMLNKDGTEKRIPWKPSIHLKKVDARIWLQNTGVRIQRLQDINEEDAINEGIEGDINQELWKNYLAKDKSDCCLEIYPSESFKSLIKSIHGPEIWNQNPWVRVIDFRVLSLTGRPDKFP